MRYYLIPFEEVCGLEVTFQRADKKEEGLADLRILSDEDR